MTKFLLILVLPFVFLEAIWDVMKDIPRDLKYSFKRHWREWKDWWKNSYWEDTDEDK